MDSVKSLAGHIHGLLKIIGNITLLSLSRDKSKLTVIEKYNIYRHVTIE